MKNLFTGFTRPVESAENYPGAPGFLPGNRVHGIFRDTSIFEVNRQVDMNLFLLCRGTITRGSVCQAKVY